MAEINKEVQTENGKSSLRLWHHLPQELHKHVDLSTKMLFCAYVQHNEEATVTTDNIIITF